MRNILLTIAYDGTAYHGWQRQPGLATVQGTVEEALTRLILGEEAATKGPAFEINGTGRTDAGVHALGQCATVSLPDEGIPTDRIAYALTNLLPGDIQIVSAKEVPEEFHARFDAKGKTYRYRIAETAQEDLFQRGIAYRVPVGLNLDAMKEAAAKLVGTHDFAAFQATGGEEKETTVRTIYDIALTEEPLHPLIADAAARGEGEGEPKQTGRLITVDVTGDGFLYNMVRIIAGTLVDVGFGKLTPEDVARAMEAKDRALAGHTAPPHGLFLKQVYFEDIPSKG